MKVDSDSPRRGWLRAALALVILVALVLATHPWWVGALMGRYLSHTSERSVRFDSIRIAVDGALRPVIHLRGVEIANAPWADSKRPFAIAPEALMVVSWRSIAEARPVLDLLVLRDAEIDLERQADGTRNWRLRDPQDRGPGRIKVLTLQPERSRLRIAHRGVALDVQTSATPSEGEAPLTGSGESVPLRIDFEGSLRGMPIAGRIATGPVLSFYETGRWFPLRGRADLGGVGVEAEGRAADIFREPLIDARAVASGKSLAAWRPFLGTHYTEARAFRVEGHVVADERRYAIEEARAKVGATDLAGELGFSHGEERRAVRARLKSESADLADLLWLVGADPRQARAAAGRKGATDDSDAATPSSRPFELERAREFDADLSFAARRLRAPRLPWLRSLAFEATLRDGAATASDVDVGVGDGHAKGRLSFDARPTPPAAEADLEWHGVRIEEMMDARQGTRKVAGALRGRIALKAAGASAAALLADARGSVSVSLAGGTISSMLDAKMGLEGGKIVRSLISGDEALALPCAALTLDVAKGRGRIRQLAIDSANTLTTGRGEVDLRDRTIDIVLTPTPKRPGLFDLDRSIRLVGPLLKPQRSLVDRVAIAADGACAAGRR